MPVQTQILTRRGTAASWTSTNPTLGAGEIGYETDTGRFKIGTGAAAWASLGYFNRDPLTTKGDLYTFSTTDDRLAVGANGESLVADSSTSTGLRYQPTMAAGKNAIINGGMDIWQRGTTSAISTSIGGSWGGDRFLAYRAVSGGTVSQNSSTSLDGFKNAMRMQRNSGNTSTSGLTAIQNVESSMAIPYAGKTVTLSFWGRKGADYSAASSAVNVYLWTGTGTDQPWYAFTGQATAISTTATLTTSWQRFSFTATLGSTITEFATEFLFNPTGTAGTNDWWEFTGVQLEVGSVATNFTRAGGTIQGELAACQRYYYLHASGDVKSIANSAYYAANQVYGTLQFPVTMRVAPTAAFTSGTDYYANAAAGTNDLLNAFAADRFSTTGCWIFNSSEASGTIGYAGVFRTNNASASLAFTSEL